MNRAVQGDIVVVEIFDEKEWKAPADAVVDQVSAFPFVSCMQPEFYAQLLKATLRNDDPDESEEDEDTDEAIAEESEKRILAREASGKKPSSEKQPTGRIVGIITRNWRA